MLLQKLSDYSADMTVNSCKQIEIKTPGKCVQSMSSWIVIVEIKRQERDGHSLLLN